jgi:hypothetical protein
MFSEQTFRLGESLTGFDREGERAQFSKRTQGDSLPLLIDTLTTATIAANYAITIVIFGFWTEQLGERPWAAERLAAFQKLKRSRPRPADHSRQRPPPPTQQTARPPGRDAVITAAPKRAEHTPTSPPGRVSDNTSEPNRRCTSH